MKLHVQTPDTIQNTNKCMNGGCPIDYYTKFLLLLMQDSNEPLIQNYPKLKDFCNDMQIMCNMIADGPL